jgi:hypothetical protein
MFRMSHLGPHTFVAQDSHRTPTHRRWTHDFDRTERHRLVEDDRRARWHIAGILVAAAIFNVAMLSFVVIRFS